MKAIFRPLSAIFAAALVSSCAALVSETQVSEGVPYYLPRTVVRFHVNQDAPERSVVEKLDVPDRANPYYLHYNASWLADENVCISRSTTGLLQKVYFGAQDRTSDILLNLVQTFARVGGPAAPQDAGAERLNFGRCAGEVVSAWQDPYDFDSIAKFNKRLCNVQVDIPDLRQNTRPANVACPHDAVCFATKSSYRGAFRGIETGTAAAAINEEVASAADVGWIEVNRAFFNKRITMLDFDNGVLTTVRIRKDSELLGLSEWPIKAAERLLAGNALGMAFSGYQERLIYLKQRKALTDAGATTPPAPTPPDPTIGTQVFGCAIRG
jgi:hypothetical protein